MIGLAPVIASLFSWSVLMGSFGQISIGIVCLAAAFAFGSYVNNHPPTGHPHQAQLDSGLNADPTAADSTTRIGKVQSLTDNFAPIEKRPAPIKSLQNRFKIPQIQNSTAATELPTSNRLPPPSQLGFDRSNAGTASSNTNQPIAETKNQGLGLKVNDVPDFSSIVAEFKNTKIELPPLGNMPAHAQPHTTAAIAQPMNRKGMGRLDLIPNNVPDFANVAPKLDVQPAQVSPVVQIPDFKEDDFAPKLKNHLSTNPRRLVQQNGTTQSAQPIQRMQTPPPVEFSDQSMAKSFGFAYEDPPNPFADSNQATPLETAASSNWNTSSQPLGRELTGQGYEANRADEYERQVTEQFKRTHSAPTNRANRVTSRQPLPELPKPASLQRSPGGSNLMGNDAYRGTTRLAEIGSRNSGTRQISDPRVTNSENRVRTMLPFGLNDQGKNQLAAIRTRTNSQLDSSSTQFVEHVIQRGESLQSISERYFGTPEYYLDIYLANRNKLQNPVDTPDGVAIRIPIY